MELKSPPIEKVIVAKAAPAPKELIQTTKTDATPAKPGTPRATLEKIAAGNLTEAFSSTEQLPSREVVQQILTEANKLLLDTKDLRLLFSALATQASDTPLGNQMRIDTLRMLSDVDPLAEKIKNLQLPQENPDNNALIQTIKNYNEKNPHNTISTENLDAQTLSQILQTNTSLTSELWEGITGQSGFTGFQQEPKRLLQIAELDINEQNMANAEALFSQVRAQKEPPASIMTKFTPPLMIGAFGIMFISQMTSGEERPSH